MTRITTGATLKNYFIHEQVGEGGFGAVFRATQLPPLEREVAIKAILPEYANQSEFIRRFEVEAQLIARLEHPHIIPLYDYWRDPDGAYLVMRYIRGGNLTSHLGGNKLDIDTTLKILSQVAGGLDRAHRAGVIHRDIKPDNIMLDEDGNAYLTDFGIARVYDEKNSKSVTKGIIGSIAYMPPEMLQELPPSPASDIYSLGIVLYEMLTGEHPQAGKSTAEIVVARMTEDLPDILELRPDIPIKVDEVIQRATSRETTGRYDNVREFVNDLQRASTPTEEFESIEIIVKDIQIANPYKGLRAFDAADASEFFGREKMMTHLIGRLTETDEHSGFLAVVGPSGSGKSSLVNAGLVPRLRDGAIDGSDKWYYVEFTPGTSPLTALENALKRVALKSTTTFDGSIQSNALTLALETVLPRVDDKLLIVIDQFEELYTLADDNEREKFIEILFHAVRHVADKLHLIITIRADFFDRLITNQDLHRLILNRTEIVLPLNREELEEAITKPASNLNLSFEEGLVEAIIDDVSDELAALPLLQYALTEIFERRDQFKLTLRSYHEIGGVTGALTRRAEDLYQEQNTAGQDSIRRIFLNLVTPGEGTEDTRRRAFHSEILNTDMSDIETRREILNLYGTYRLLTFDKDDETRNPTVEVAHEALIRNWGRLRQWIDDSREELRLRRIITTMAEEWQQTNRNKEFLTGGMRLEQFKEVTASEDISLTELEGEFLAASIAEVEHQENLEAERERRETFQRRFFRATIVGILLVIVAAIGLLSAFYVNQTQSWKTEALFFAGLSAQQLDTGSPMNAQLLALESVSHFNENPSFSVYRPESFTALIAALTNPVQEQIYLAHADDVEFSVWNSSETRILSADNSGNVYLRDATVQSEPLAVFQHDAKVNAFIFSADETQFLSYSEDMTIRIWNINNPDGPLLTLQHETSVSNVIWNTDETLIVAGLDDGTIVIWDRNDTDEPRTVIDAHGDRVQFLAFSPDETQFVSTSFDNTAKVWTLENLDEPLYTIEHGNWVWGASWNTDGTRLMTYARDATASIWDVENPETPLFVLGGHGGSVYSADWNDDETQIYTASFDGLVRVWQIEDEARVLYTLAHEGPVNSVEWDTENQQMLTSSNDGGVRIWSTISPYPLISLMRHDGAVFDANWSADRSRVMSNSSDATVRIWLVGVNSDVLRTYHHAEWVDSVLFDSTEDWILSASVDGTAVVRDIAESEPPIIFEHGEHVRTAIWSTDETRILTASANGGVYIWAITNTDEPLEIFQHESSVRGASWNNDETRILSWTDDGTVSVWDVNNTTEPLAIMYHADVVFGATWNSDETQILSWSEDNTVRIWDIDNPDAALAVLRHENIVYHAQWIDDENRVATASEDGTARIWNVNAPATDPVIFQHDDPVNGLIFNANESRLMTWTSTGRVHIWSVNGDDPLLFTMPHFTEVRGAMWSDDETEVLTWAADGQIRLWNLANLDVPPIILTQGGQIWGAIWTADRSHLLTYSSNGSIYYWLFDQNRLLDIARSTLTREFSTEDRSRFFLD